MMLVKFIFNVWVDEIVPTLSELHGARWPGFEGTAGFRISEVWGPVPPVP